MSKVQIVWFRDLKLWSVALQNQTTLKSHFPLIELKEILVDLTEHRKITILDNEFYKEPTISSKTNEISIRKSGLGSEFKVKKRVKILKGDLVIAKMHTQNGLYAFANDEFASTTTFIPFKILENKINKNYLFILLKQTLARLQKFDSVNRETYKTDEILSLQIPLPPLEIQQQIVAKIESIKAQIKALQVEEKRLKDEIEAYIYIALGLEKKQELQRQKVFIVRFKDLNRWDTRHNQANQHAKTQIVFENLENLTTYMQRGKTPTYSTIKKYPVIAQKCVQWNGLEIQKALFINPDSLSSYTKERFLQDDDILLNSTGIGTLGRAIIYKSKDNPYNIAVADGHITVMRFDTQRILPQYFYHYFSSALIQDNIEEYATGSTKQKELSLTLIKQIKIPLPPLSVQEKIVNAIEMIKAQIAIIDSKLESLEARKAQILESALSESNKREREQTELKEILIEIESLLLQKAFLQNLITQILQKVETPANLESLLDSIPTAYHTKHHIDRPEPLGKVSSNTESRLAIINEANNQSIESDLDSMPTPPPHGWEVKTLGEICEINPKIDFKELTKLEKEVSFLPMEAVKTDGKTFEKLQRKAKEAQGFTKFADNDLLWAKITPCMQNKKSLVVNGLKNGFGFGSTEFFVLRSKDSRRINIHFILQFLRLDLILQNASETFKGSAGQQRVPKEFLQNLKIPLPPLSVQKQIVAHIQKIESSIATTQDKAKALELELERYIESTL